ncbi:molecular chaperone DnaJ, partial [Spirulina subsalsa FACHB-351]|nr:molecular chaperone DnaJ [Spirulina subsalsa FACHB-351]
PPPPPPPVSPLSPSEQKLKGEAYQRLQDLLKKRRFARAIALVEGLALRLPQDAEVRQWQAIAYQAWGRQLIRQGQPAKGKIYLKKALRTDPHNRALVAEIAEEFRRLGQLV